MNIDPIVPIVPAGGNTKPPPKKKQISPSKRWCFTLNNYSEEHVEMISSIVPSICSKYIVGKEICATTGTPHLQGFIIFKEKWRPLSKIPIKQIHWEKAMGNDMSQNYCGKENNVILFKGIPKPLVKVEYNMLRQNQKDIVDLFKEDEDPIHGRKIYWFWETEGNWGKSFLCLHLVDFCGALVVQGKNNDILCGVREYIEKNGFCPRLIVFDVPRCNENHVSYSAIESIKGGLFYSGKYESGMCRFNKPHIVVFSNETPQTYKMSEDRWIIKEL